MTDTRLFPVSPEFFNTHIKPLVAAGYSRAGRPALISDYTVFCAMLYVLRTGIPWRDLPASYGHWHRIYQRFKRSADRGVWWQVLMHLQKGRTLTRCVVLADSTSVQLHRHGGGHKGGNRAQG